MRSCLSFLYLFLLFFLVPPAQAQYTASVDWTNYWAVEDSGTYAELDFTGGGDVSDIDYQLSSYNGTSSGTNYLDFDSSVSSGGYSAVAECSHVVTTVADNNSDDFLASSSYQIENSTTGNSSSNPVATASGTGYCYTEDSFTAPSNGFRYLDVKATLSHYNLSYDENSTMQYACELGASIEGVFSVGAERSLGGSTWTVWESWTTDSGSHYDTYTVDEDDFPLVFNVPNVKLYLETSNSKYAITSAGWNSIDEDGTLLTVSPEGADASAHEWVFGGATLEILEVTTSP